MRYTICIFLLLFFQAFKGQAQDLPNSKDINVKNNLNLEVLFTIYNQIWTPFLNEDVSESMVENTQLMRLNHDYFKDFKDHKAIKKTREFMNKSGTDLFLYAFYYDDFPDTKRIKEIPEILTKDINPNRSLALDEIDSLMSDISLFFIESKFDDFYQKYAYVYDIAKIEVKKNLPKGDFIQFLENYFGITYSKYNFHIIPFFKAEFGMAHQLQTNQGMENITFISPFEPARIEGIDKVKYVGYESEDDILEWIVHEYSHTFFNPALTLESNLEKLSKFDHLYEPINDNPQIGDWFSVFGEHIAVAFEVRAATLLGDNDRSRAILERHEDWYYLEHFVDQLIYYENNRSKFPNIHSFMPELIDSCENLK